MDDDEYLQKMIELQETYKEISESKYFVYADDDIEYVETQKTNFPRGELHYDYIAFACNDIEEAKRFCELHKERKYLIFKTSQYMKDDFFGYYQHAGNCIEQYRKRIEELKKLESEGG